MIPLQPNRIQQIYIEQNPKLETFQGNREIILKARQLGLSTFISAKMFLNTIQTPNTQSIIIAQDETNSKRLFQIVKRYYENQPPERAKYANTDSKSELWWKDIDSYFTVGWAGSRKIGRGGTINNAHASEVAFWENAGEIVSGLLQSVPLNGNIWLESTANGVSNYFYKEYKAAERGESAYTPRFFPWYLDSSYASRLLIGGTQEFNATEEEEELAHFYQLSNEQLIWRRNKILELRNAKMGDDAVGDFPQEYPSSADEAFLTTGTGVFNQKTLLNEVLPNVLPPLVGVDIPRKFIGLRMVQRNNNLKIYHRPNKLYNYLVAADPAEGINDNGDHDYSTAHVISVDSWEQVLTLRGRWEPHEFAGILVEIGQWYNDGLIAVERNNHGHSVLNSLINSYEYGPMKGWHGVYYHADYDSKSRVSSRKPGFPTNVKTKAIAIGSLNELIEDGSLKINDKPTIEELRLYVKLPGQKMGCAVGHDDLVSALSIGSAILKDTGFLKVVERTKNKKSYGVIGRSRTQRKGVMV